jgi:hypothetical protein
LGRYGEEMPKKGEDNGKRVEEEERERGKNEKEVARVI